MHPAGLFCRNLKKAVDNSPFSWYNNTRRQGRRTSYGGLAQLGERLHGMQEVTGSIPVISTRKKSTAQECAVLFCCVCPAMQLLNSCWTFAESYGIILSAIAGIVHRLVYQPSKLRRWVRFPLPAPRKNRLDPSGSGRFSYVLVALLFFVHSNRRSLPCFFCTFS